MVERSRRKLLVALAGATALAGCGGGESSPTAASESEQPTESPSPTPAESATNTETSTPTPTPEPIKASDLAFVASVIRQPSEDAPGKVRASLTNRSGESLSLLGGHLIPVSGDVAAGPDDPLILLPDESDRVNEYSWRRDGETFGGADVDDATYDDCWRAPGDGFLRTDLADAADLADGETVDADFYPLAAAGADCPQGRYTVQDQLTLDETDQSVHIELTLDIDADGRLAVEGSFSIDDA